MSKYNGVDYINHINVLLNILCVSWSIYVLVLQIYWTDLWYHYIYRAPIIFSLIVRITFVYQ